MQAEKAIMMKIAEDRERDDVPLEGRAPRGPAPARGIRHSGGEQKDGIKHRPQPYRRGPRTSR